MNRLDDIREKYAPGKIIPYNTAGDLFNTCTSDIEYLLNEVDRYKNVLRALDSVLHFDRKIEEPNVQPFTTGTEVMFHQERLDRIRAYNIVYKMANEALKEE